VVVFFFNGEVVKIKLDRIEIVALQTIRRNPGSRAGVNVTDLINFRLIEPEGDGYKITDAGDRVLKMNTPVLDCGQNMKAVLGFSLNKIKK